MYIANALGIKHQNIITCGSSKGGYASLFFGLKYNLGHVIAGAPQTYLGNYLTTANETETFSFISGDKEGSLKYLNNILFNQVKKTPNPPNVNIHVGKGDHHYKDHVLPFTETLKENSIPYHLDVGDYAEHGEVKYYKDFLDKRLQQIMPSVKFHDDIPIILGVNVEKEGEVFKVTTLATGDNITFAWYVYRNGEREHIEWYKQGKSFRYEARGQGNYRFLAFVKDDKDQKTSEETEIFNV